jgi:hypothetical protein
VLFCRQVTNIYHLPLDLHIVDLIKKTADRFPWTFTPPSAAEGEDDFRAFIAMFLTTENVIPISLDLQEIQIKVGDRPVVLNGVEVDTEIQGIGAPLITRVDVYLGLNSLYREVYFRFTLGALSFTFCLIY